MVFKGYRCMDCGYTFFTEDENKNECSMCKSKNIADIKKASKTNYEFEYREYKKIIKIFEKSKLEYIRKNKTPYNHKNCNIDCTNPFCNIGQFNNIINKCNEKIDDMEKLFEESMIETKK